MALECSRPTETQSGVREVLAELEQTYQDYLADSAALFRHGTGFLQAVRSVLGTNTIKSSAIHRKFYDRVSECVAALSAALDAAPDPAAADTAARMLLEERPKGQNLTQYSWLCAAQTLAVPLLPHVSQRTLEQLYTGYCAAHRKRDRLPRQQELVAAMERRLAD